MNGNTPKRALIFSLMYAPFVGGAEVALREITDRVSPHDIEFDMITLRGDSALPKEEHIGNVHVHRIGPAKRGGTESDLYAFPWYLVKVLYVPLAFLKAMQLYKKKRHDFLWSMMTNMGFPAVFFKKFYKNDMPFLLTMQDGDTKEHIAGRKRIRMFGSFFDAIFVKATMVQVISTYLGELAKDFGFRGPVEVVPNGVQLERFSKEHTPEDFTQLEKRLGLEEGKRYIITISRMVHKNAADITIRTLQYLPEDVEFLLGGDGPDEEMLKALAKSEGVEERVHFLGNVDQAEVPLHLQRADVFTRPSRSEGQGISFIEAMGAGVPVVATPVGGIPDFLFAPNEEEVGIERKAKPPTGLFCKVDDPKHLAGQIEKLLQNKVLRDEIVDNARKLVEEKYDWDHIVKRMKREVFDKVTQAS